MPHARTLRELLADTQAEAIGVAFDTPVDHVTTDSRAVRPGSVFVAIPGTTTDGHAYVDGAIAAGAIAAIVETGRAIQATPRVEVADARAALPIVAANRWGWPGRSLRGWGLTGTNGKTTTAHLLSAIFDARGWAHARLGTTGNWLVDRHHDGGFTTPFPLELQSLLAEAVHLGARELVMEVSSHALDQARVAPLRYAGAALTSFSQDHLDYHPTMEAYLEAKCRLITSYLDPGAVVVAPRHGAEMGRGARRFLEVAAGTDARPIALVRAGEDPGGVDEMRVSAVKRSETRTRFDLDGALGSVQIDAAMVGDFNVDNLAIAACFGLAAGVDADVIARALATTMGAPGRLQRVVDPASPDAGPAVFVDYAHTPDAVARALAALRPTTRGRVIVVLGCGGDRDHAKRPQMGAAAAAGADVFWATSDNPRTEDPDAIVDMMLAGVEASHAAQVHRQVDRAAAIAESITAAVPDDTVLLAGKGHEDYQVIGETKRPFDDREHALTALQARTPA